MPAELKPKSTVEPVLWSGETDCNFCHKPCGDVLIDGATKYGPWAVMCMDCRVIHAYPGYGTGKAQMYERNAAGEYVKVRG